MKEYWYVYFDFQFPDEIGTGSGSMRIAAFNIEHAKQLVIMLIPNIYIKSVKQAYD